MKGPSTMTNDTESPQTAETDVPDRRPSWGRKHFADNPTHRAREGLDDPGSCDDCSERSPIWNLVTVDTTPMDAQAFDRMMGSLETPDPMPRLKAHLADATTPAAQRSNPRPAGIDEGWAL